MKTKPNKQKTHYKYKVGDYIRVINTNIFSHSIKKGDIGKVILVNDDTIELIFDYYLIQDVYFDFDKYIEKVEINLDKLFYDNYCIKKELASLKDKLNTFIKEMTNG